MAWVERRLVIVEWKDAACDSSWQSEGQTFTAVMCWSIGLIVQDDEEVLAIAGTTTESGDFNQTMAIPRDMVVSVTDVTR